MTISKIKQTLLQEQGGSLVEFGLVMTLVLVGMFGLIDLTRLVLVYTTTANAARAGLRYAVTHGAGRSTAGSAVDGPSGPGANPSQVLAVIQSYSIVGTLQSGLTTTNVTYPDGTNTVGSKINVSVTYPYTPMVAIYPLTVTVGSSTQGRVTCCQ